MGNILTFVWQIRCGLAFQLSPFAVDDVMTYAAVMDAQTSQVYPWTGEWLGPEAIAEYLSGYGSRFASELQSLSGDTDLLSDLIWGETSWNVCEVSLAQPSRVRAKAPFAPGEACVDFVGASQIRFELRGFPLFPSIYISNFNIWTDEGFVRTLFTALTSQATAEDVCDVLVNSCSEPNLTTEACVTQFNELPGFDQDFWMDGDTKGCRILHAAYARDNPVHCPHVSFAFEPDENGLVKCAESKLWKDTDIFTAEQIASFKTFQLPYATSNPYLAAYPNGDCPPL